MWPNSLYSGGFRTEYTLSKTRPICFRFLQNCCPYGAMSCSYSHNKDDARLCMLWKRGQCHNNRCLGRHYYLERDEVSARRMPLKQVTGNSAFSSPLVVKVKTLTEKHRREEVDLETGKRRSWIETENKELIDITGEASPVHAPRKAVLEESMDNNDGKLKAQVPEKMQKKKKLEISERTKKTENRPKKCSACGKEFKGERGVKSHLSHPKSKCGKAVVVACANLDASVYVISDDSM